MIYFGQMLMMNIVVVGYVYKGSLLYTYYHGWGSSHSYGLGDNELLQIGHDSGYLGVSGIFDGVTNKGNTNSTNRGSSHIIDILLKQKNHIRFL